MTVKESISLLSRSNVEHLRGLIRIRSVLGPEKTGCPFGRGTKEPDYCLRLSKSLGLRTGHMDNRVGGVNMAPAMNSSVSSHTLTLYRKVMVGHTLHSRRNRR
jgi:hypothetical protein